MKRQSKNRTVNKQNCRIYATENPQEIQEVPLHDDKVTVWCGVSAKTVIGPFFFHDDQFCDAINSSKAYATVLVSTRRRSTAHKSHNNRFSEEIVSRPFDVEKWWFGLATALARFDAARLLVVEHWGQHSWRNSRYSGRNLGENDGKCCMGPSNMGNPVDMRPYVHVEQR